MIRDAERFSKLLSGVQAGVVSIAVIVGGAWTLYTFNSQLQVENAKAQLAKLNRELDAEPKLEIGIELKQLEGGASRRILVGVLTIKNTGTADTAVVLADTPIELFEVSFGEDGVEQWQSVRKLPLRQSDKTIYGTLVLHAGSQVSRPFLAPTQRAGLYAVKFSAERSKAEIDRVQGMGTPSADITNRVEWGGHAYVWVK